MMKRYTSTPRCSGKLVKQLSSDLDHSWATEATDGTAHSAIHEKESAAAAAAAASSSLLLLPSRVPNSTASVDDIQPSNKVRFAETKHGEIKCQIYEVSNWQNLVEEEEENLLWWKAGEIAEIRAACQDLVASAHGKTRGIAVLTAKFLQGGWHADEARCTRRLQMQMSQCSAVRGLEHYFIDECPQMIEQHVQAVIQSQKSQDSRGLRKVAKKLSKPSRELALRRAQQDRREALKASLTPWDAPNLKQSD